MMTTAEKRDVINQFCDGQSWCEHCSVGKLEFCEKYNEYNAPEEVVDEWYDAIVKSDENNDKNVELVETLDGHVETIDMPTPTPIDMVNHPSHYEIGKFECIDVMIETQGVDAVMDFCICNALKYLYRHKRKNGVEDIKKARWYIDKYLELWEGQQCNDTSIETKC